MVYPVFALVPEDTARSRRGVHNILWLRMALSGAYLVVLTFLEFVLRRGKYSYNSLRRYLKT